MQSVYAKSTERKHQQAIAKDTISVKDYIVASKSRRPAFISKPMHGKAIKSHSLLGFYISQNIVFLISNF